MKLEDRLEKLQHHYTTFTYAIATQFGLQASELSRAVNDNMLERPERGIYVFPGFFADDYAVLSQRFSKGVFSGVTARVLYDLTDEFPWHMEMTFPQGYHHLDLAKYHVKAKYQVPDRYLLGITTTKTEDDNDVRIYSPERTLLDTWERKDVTTETKKQTYQNFLKVYGRNSERVAQLAMLQEQLYPRSTLMELMAVSIG